VLPTDVRFSAGFRGLIGFSTKHPQMRAKQDRLKTFTWRQLDRDTIAVLPTTIAVHPGQPLHPGWHSSAYTCGAPCPHPGSTAQDPRSISICGNCVHVGAGGDTVGLVTKMDQAEVRESAHRCRSTVGLLCGFGFIWTIVEYFPDNLQPPRPPFCVCLSLLPG